MGLLSLHSSPVIAGIPSSSRRRASTERPTSFIAQPLSPPNSSTKCSDVVNIGSTTLRPLSSGFSPAAAATGSNPSTGASTKQEISSKDDGLVFVAGATGKVGSRTVRELLRLGFRVRAGVRSAQRAETLVQSVSQMKLDDVAESSTTPPVERLEIVECDLENKGAIGPVLKGASTVVCCIGASEKEIFDVTGPYRIDYRATENLINAATLAKVDHFILLTSLGTNKIGFPAFILNLFWGVLIWKRKAEEALITSGLPFTIVRPGGMERPTDSYKETHNIVLANEDTYFGGQVSNLQVAELMAFMVKNRTLSLFKVVEVIAETTAPLAPMEDLLATIPPQREIPAEPKPDPVPPSVETKSVKPVAEVETSEPEVMKGSPLSPYAMYEDLKPPTSPTPTPSTTPRSPVVNDVGYDDLKPPTSPSPNTPIVGSTISTSSTGSDPLKSSVPQTPDDEKHNEQQKLRPLSPFTMYADLKPPTSPVPSVPKY